MAATIATSVAVVMALLVAPADRLQGQAQRLMYLHVPTAWTAYVCFAAVLVCGIAYLRGADLKWDRRARAFAEAGVVLATLTLATGAIWGQATWGVGWTWDARLVSTAAMVLVYVGHLAVRHAFEDVRQGARWAAVVGVCGFATVPVVHFSVLWWRTLHQPPTILGPDPSPPIHPTMAAALAMSLAAVMITAGWVVKRRSSSLTERSMAS